MLPYELTEKVNLLKKQCFYRNNKMFCGTKSYNTYSTAVFRHWHSPTIVCPADDTLYEVGPEIHCSGVSSRYCWCCYGNQTAGSNAIWQLFIVVNAELNKVSLCQKYFVNVVNLWNCHINCSAVRFIFWDRL